MIPILIVLSTLTVFTHRQEISKAIHKSHATHVVAQTVKGVGHGFSKVVLNK